GRSTRWPVRQPRLWMLSVPPTASTTSAPVRCARGSNERHVRTRAAAGAGPWRGPAGRRPGDTFIWAAGMAVRPDPAAIVLLGRAQGPGARPLGRSRIVVEESRDAGQPELMFP